MANVLRYVGCDSILGCVCNSLPAAKKKKYLLYLCDVFRALINSLVRKKKKKKKTGRRRRRRRGGKKVTEEEAKEEVMWRAGMVDDHCTRRVVSSRTVNAREKSKGEEKSKQI